MQIIVTHYGDKRLPQRWSGYEIGRLYHELIKDNRWAFKNLGNVFSAPAMVYRWTRAS